MRAIHHRAWLLSLLSAVLQVLIFPLPSFYPLCWLAVAPLLVALLRARSPESLQLELDGTHLLPARSMQGFLLGYFCGILFYAGTCNWIFNTMRQYGGLSTAMSALMLLLFCMTAGLGHGLFAACFARMASSRRSLRFALLLSPFFWVAVELARTQLLDFPWNLLGTVQVDNIPLARIATVTGVYGISFEIILVNAALATGLLLPRGRRIRMVAMTVIIAALLQAGRWLPQTPSPSSHVAVLVQENVPVLEGSAWTTDYFQAQLGEFSGLSSAPTASGVQPDLIIWPESPSPFFTRDPVFLQPLTALAQQTHSWLVIGSTGVDDPMSPTANRGAYYNSAAILNPEGNLVARYDKIHLVPFGEFIPFRHSFPPFVWMVGGQVPGDFTPGREPAVFQLPDPLLKIAPLICFEDTVGELTRQPVLLGAQLLVNLTNDGWFNRSDESRQHLANAVFRTVENRRPLIRAANTGVTCVIDEFGRIRQLLADEAGDTFSPGVLSGVVDVATDPPVAFYTRYGEAFSIICLVFSTMHAAISLFVRRSRPRPA